MLKVSQDHLTKVWKPIKIWEPLYKGGKLQSSPDGKKFICEYEGNIKIVDVDDTGNAKSFFDDSTPFEPVATFCVHPKWMEMVVATTKFSIVLWTLEDKKSLKTIKAHRMPILCMDYDPTGTLVVTGSADKNVRVWDIHKGYCTHSFSEHADIVKTVYFHPDPKQLLVYSTSEDNSICVCDLRKQALVSRFSEHVSLPTKVAFSSDSNLFISSGRDKVLNFYLAKDQQHLKTLPIMEELESVIVLPEESSMKLINASYRKDEITRKKRDHPKLLFNVVVTAGGRGMIRFFVLEIPPADASRFTFTPLIHFPLSSLEHHSSLTEDVAALMGISSMEFLPKSKEIIITTNDFNICYYSIEQLAQYFTSVNHLVANSKTSGLVPKLGAEKLLIGNHGDILDMLKIPSSSSSPEEASSEIQFKIALVANSHQLRVLNENLVCQVLEGHQDIILSVDVSPDGEWLVTSSKDKTCRVWSLAKMECVAVGEGHTDAIGSICMSHNPATYQSRKAFMVSGAGDKILKRWSLPVHTFQSMKSSIILQNSAANIQKLTSSHSIRAHDKDINCVSVSPNDAIIASASQDKSIRLWNSEDLTPVATLHGHKRGVWKIFFSSYEKVLFSCSGDRTVKMWSMSDYSILRTFEGNTASVLNGKLINFGTQFVTASADGLLRLYDTRSSECENTFDVHEDRVWAIEYFTNKRKTHQKKRKYNDDQDSGHEEKDVEHEESFLLSGGSDSKLILWKDMTKEEELNEIKKKEEVVLLEQQLMNDIRNKNYLKALKLSLQLKHRQKVLQILQSILDDNSDEKDDEEEEDERKDQSSQLILKNQQKLFDTKWSKKFDNYVVQLNPDEIKQFLQFLKDWNTNSRYCYIVQLIFSAFLRLFAMKDLLAIPEMREFLNGFHAYTERHYQRINRLLQSSYYISYLITAINGFLPLETMEKILSKEENSENNNESESKPHLIEDTFPMEVIADKVEESEEVTFSISKEPEEGVVDVEKETTTPKKKKANNKKKKN